MHEQLERKCLVKDFASKLSPQLICCWRQHQCCKGLGEKTHTVTLIRSLVVTFYKQGLA